MSRIRFHIGTHKTATTHLQLTLASSRLVPGTRYVPLKFNPDPAKASRTLGETVQLWQPPDRTNP